MSKKADHAASVNEITDKVKNLAPNLRSAESEPIISGNFRYNIKKRNSAKRLKKLPSISKHDKKRIEYYLVSIGSFALSSPKDTPKWTDVASIIDQGIASHKVVINSTGD